MASAKTNGHKRVTVKELAVENAQLSDSLELMTERMVELELALDDEGWVRLSDQTEREFSREGLRRIAYLCRINYVKNPLIKRAVEVQRYYVWAQGVNFTARHVGINDLVHAFLDDDRNEAELTSHQARGLKEVDLQVEANIFFTLFTDQVTGRVRVRTIPFGEIGEVIKNPEDAKQPWFYKREWHQRTFDLKTGATKDERRIRYYPDFRHHPTDRPANIGDHKVEWDAPIFHLKVGGMSDMTFGIPEVYAALDWAKAVKTDLEDFATLRRALARFAWNLVLKGGPKTIAAAKKKLATTISSGTPTPETNPPPVTGATFISSEAANMQPMRTAGVTPHPDDARRIGLMVAAAVGIPETILFGDADVGNLATSKTLDRPTELKIVDRQALWASIFQTLFDYVIRANLRATSPQFTLDGVTLVDDEAEPEPGQQPAQRVEVTATDPDGNVLTADVDVDFPPVVEHDPEIAIKALVNAATLGTQSQVGTIPRKALAREIMTTLHFEDVDALLDQLWPEGSNENQPPVGYEPPAPVLPGGGGGFGSGDQTTTPGQMGDQTPMAAALREFRLTIRPILERWQAEHSEAERFADRIEAHLVKVGETIATVVEATKKE